MNYVFTSGLLNNDVKHVLECHYIEDRTEQGCTMAIGDGVL